MDQSGSFGEKPGFFAMLGRKKATSRATSSPTHGRGDQLQVVRRFRLRDPPRRGTANKINMAEDNG